ncbi:hypothetical protein D9M68_548130 [compost metagenome]
MSRAAWAQLAASLDTCAATRNFAAGLELIRVDGQVLHLKSSVPASKSALDKLSSAISRHTGAPIALVLRHGPHQALARSYSDETRRHPWTACTGAASSSRITT